MDTELQFFFMPGIYIMAAITTALCLAVIGGVIFKKTSPKLRKSLLVVGLLGAPMFFVAFYVLRLPLDNLLLSIFSADSSIYRTLTTFYAPVTEELAKLAILFLPFLASRVSKKNVHWFAFSIGLGFGVGELWFLARDFASVPELAGLPWYALTGFLFERFMVCFLHGAFLYVSGYFLVRKKYYGILYAVGLHWLLNIPIFIGALFEIGRSALWASILSTWVVVVVFLMLYITTKLLYGTSRVGFLLLGKATCPSCGKVYERSIFGLNMGVKRYERCLHCKKWHWMSGSRTGKK